jgi:hypothetical protein
MLSIPLHGLVASCVAAGWDHSAAIINGRVYTWGRGVKGQLGDAGCQSRKQARDLTNFTFQLRSLLTRAAHMQPWPVSFGEAGGAERVFASVKCGRLDPSDDYPLDFCMPRDALAQLLLRRSYRRRVRAVPPSASCPPPFTAFFSRVFTWGDPKEGKLGCTCAAVTSPRQSTVSTAAAAESAMQPSDAPGNDSSSAPSLKACFSLPQEVMLVLMLAVQCPRHFVAFQLPEFGPSVDQMFVVEVACGSR